VVGVASIVIALRLPERELRTTVRAAPADVAAPA
jgi:hypothetical protein